MEDISSLNASFFRSESEVELKNTHPDIYGLIDSENEYEDSSIVPFLPLHRLNSICERQQCLDIISEVIETGLFTSGHFIGQIENKLREFYDAQTCVATSSGTDALKIALKAVGVNAGDEVILPVNSFAATENAIMAIGATPVFANIDASYNMIPGEVERLRNVRTKAVIPVCLYGSTRNISAVFIKARQAEIPVILDAAQCFGIKSVMNFCDILALSFNPFKNIGTFGKSGSLLTRSSELARISRQYSYHGFAEGKKNIKAQCWGLNSRMDNIQAATLSVKLNHFGVNSTKRCLLAARYNMLLKDLSCEIHLPIEQIENTWHLYPLSLRNLSRNELISYAKKRKVELDIYYPVLSHCGDHKLASSYPAKMQFRPSEDIHSSLVHIPLHNHMSFDEQNKVVEVLHDFFR